MAKKDIRVDNKEMLKLQMDLFCWSCSPPASEYALVVTTSFDSLLSRAGLRHLGKGWIFLDTTTRRLPYWAKGLFYPRHIPLFISVSGSSPGHWSTRLFAPAKSSSPYLMAACSFSICKEKYFIAISK